MDFSKGYTHDSCIMTIHQVDPKTLEFVWWTLMPNPKPNLISVVQKVTWILTDSYTLLQPRVVEEIQLELRCNKPPSNQRQIEVIGPCQQLTVGALQWHEISVMAEPI